MAAPLLAPPLIQSHSTNSGGKMGGFIRYGPHMRRIRPMCWRRVWSWPNVGKACWVGFDKRGVNQDLPGVVGSNLRRRANGIVESRFHQKGWLGIDAGIVKEPVPMSY